MDCNNNFSNEDVYLESFGTEDSLKKCNTCQYLEYSNGIVTCTNPKFNSNNKEGGR